MCNDCTQCYDKYRCHDCNSRFHKYRCHELEGDRVYQVLYKVLRSCKISKPRTLPGPRKLKKYKDQEPYREPGSLSGISGRISGFLAGSYWLSQKNLVLYKKILAYHHILEGKISRAGNLIPGGFLVRA
jgi:hypothetical protein